MTWPTPPPAADGPLAALAERLRTRLSVEPGARELAEALWLAKYVEAAEVRSRAAESPADQPYASPYPPARQQTETGTEPTVPAPQASVRTHLYAEGAHRPPGDGTAQGAVNRDFVRVRVPAATALPHSLGLQRALRPLQRYQPPVRTTAHRLDEQATAERAAETGLLTPVLRAHVRGEARLRLLMDASSSTSVWDSTLVELRQICAGLGAFREVQAHYVHEGADGRLTLGPSRDPARAPRAAEQLRDPTGRQLTLVLSDCAGPLWRSGQMQRLLHDWTQAAPVAVVQPLPQRLWRRTHLPARPGTLRRPEGLAARLEFIPAEGVVPPDALPIPVLGPTRAALGTWARLLSGGTGLSMPAAAAWVHADHPAAPPRPQREPADAATLVAAFRCSASRQAVSLAVSFSAVPLTLPVMQLVQRAMQPRSGPFVLAEVLLGGLMRHTEQAGWYEFLPGVREELLRLLPRGEALLVLRHSGEYVERHFGRRAHNFPALALARLTGNTAVLPDAEEQVPEAFAEVSRAVLGRFTGAVVQAPVVAPRRFISLIFRPEDATWAGWMARLLEGAGCETVLRTRLSDDELTTAPARPPEALPDRPLQVVRLLGDGTDANAMRMDAALDQVIPVDLDVDVSTNGDFHGLSPSPGIRHTPISSLTEGLARRWLFNQLGIEADASLLSDRDAEYPGPTRLVEGPVPERSPGHVLQPDALSQLRARMWDQRRPCALVGQPGTGKTQLAAEYVHRFADEYDFVAWIQAQNTDTRFETVGDLSIKINGCLEREPGLPQVIEMFTQRLPEENLRWLIVYDGWDDARDADRFPLSGGHVLITSRDPGWADTADVLRLTDTGDGPTGPAAARDELIRRALVRVDASSGTGSGFFLAPGWAVTASAVVRARHRGSFVAVTMMDGSQHQAEKVQDVGDLALLHVPAVVNVDCLWLTDRPVAQAAAVFLCWAAGSRNTPREFRTPARAFESLRNDTFALDGVHLPPGSAGGPVLDAADGSLIGVVITRREDGTGEAIRIEALRELCNQGTANTELWRGIIRAHDRHHYNRFLDRGARLTWTGVQEQVSGGSGPKMRTELYGLLAELEPPSDVEAVQALLDDPRLRTDHIPRHWRDGAGCVRHLIADDCLFLYAARVWAQLAPRSGPDQAAALTALRDWIEASARTSITDDALQDIVDVFERVDVTFTARGPVVRVEIERVSLDRSYGWRVVLRQDGEEAIQAEDMSGGSEFEVRDRLSFHVSAALDRADTVAARAAVQFCLPSELLWDLSVEDWPVRQSDVLGEERAVFVSAQDPLGRSQERRRRWEAVAKGPLQGARMGSRRRTDEPRPDWMQMPLNTVPLLCRHLDVPAVTTDIDLVRSLGYPLILWSRFATHADCAEFYEWAEELLHHSGTARELIAQVGRLRSRRHVWARRLAVYCDPPDEDR